MKRKSKYGVIQSGITPHGRHYHQKDINDKLGFIVQEGRHAWYGYKKVGESIITIQFKGMTEEQALEWLNEHNG